MVKLTGFRRDSLILFIAAAVPFLQPLLFGAVILDDDVYLQSLPAWEWLSRSLHSGDSILWSPEIMGGFPIAFTQYPFLYPPDLLLAWLLPPAQAYAWSLVLHLWLAGALTYLFCRLLGLGAAPALLTALAFQMSGEVVAGSSGFTARSAYVLPGFLLSIELMMARGGRYALALSLVVAAALLGGHPQLVLFSLGAGTIYGLFRLSTVAHRGGARRAIGLAGAMLIAGLIGVGAAAVRLLPTWEVVALSTRGGGLPVEAASVGALSLQGLAVGYLLPLSRLQTLSWGAPGYAGPAIVVMAILGAKAVASRYLGKFFIAATALTAILSLGDLTPLGAMLKLPLLSLFREASRLSLVTTFCLCMVGGMALDEFERQCRSSSRNLMRCATVLAILATLSAVGLLLFGAFFQYGSGVAAEYLRSWVQSLSLDALNPLRPRMALATFGTAVSALVVMLATRERLSHRQLEWLSIVTTAGVLVPLAAILNPTIAPETVRQIPETVRFLSAQDQPGRVFSHRPGMRLYNHMHYYGPSPEAGFADDLRYRFQAEMLAPVLNLRWAIPSADGYEQLHSRWQEALLRYMDSERISDWYYLPGKWAHLTMEQRLRVLRMVGVRYIVSGTNLSEEVAGLRLLARFNIEPGPTSRASASVFVLENINSLPRFYLASAARTYDSDYALLDAVTDGEVNPASTVLLSPGGTITVEDRQYRHQDGVNLGLVELLSSSNSEIILRVENSQPTYLVTSDSYWPGWIAYLNGREVDILRANVSGRAVWIPESGTQEIIFRFHPPRFNDSLRLSLFSALILACWSGYLVMARQADNTSCVSSNGLYSD
jgi:hypothetical protein